MSWAGWAIVLLLKEHTVWMRRPVYSGLRASQSKYYRVLWSDEEGATHYLGLGGGWWGWGWGLGKCGKEILLQNHRKDPTSGPSNLCISFWLLTNHPAPPNQPNEKCKLFYAELNEQENKKACTQRITAAVSQIPWNMMPRKIKYLLLIKLREIYQKHSLVSGNLAFLSKHWT